MSSDAEAGTADASTDAGTDDRSTAVTDRADDAAAEGRGADEVGVDIDGTPALAVRNLCKTFGGITAVDGASFGIERGKMTGLIGPNGAGKSTTFDLITGFHRPDSGEVLLDGDDITGQEPHEIADRGLVRTFQIARELEEMTVLENMMLGPQDQRGEALWQSVTPGVRSSVMDDEREVLDRVWETLDFFDIAHLAEEYAGNLSGGQRKLLELARALMADPDILLLDEPFAGVNPSLEKRLLEHVHELREQGYTFLLVEHDIDLIMENCSRVLVMHQGKLLADGEPAAVKSDERVIEAYLGGEIE
jgi:branched-chain amino acid transport system ATP-binding protein